MTDPSPSPLDPNSQFGPSLAFIYFCFGFVIGAAGTMLVLSLIKPYLPMDSGWIQSLVLAPLILGVLLGRRVAILGRRHLLTLSEAIICALFFRPPPA